MRPLSTGKRWSKAFGSDLLLLDDDDIVSKTLAEGNHWNPHVYQALAKFLPGGLIVDVGANVGALTLRFARAGAKVIAYEPHPTLVYCLEFNILALNLTNAVVIRPVALYSTAGRVAPLEQEGASPSSWAWPPSAEGIPRARYSSLFFNEKISAIKVDAQGADLHALLGMEQAILRQRPPIVFEFEAELAKLHGHTWDDYVEQLDIWGYDLKDIQEGDFLALPR